MTSSRLSGVNNPAIPLIGMLHRHCVLAWLACLLLVGGMLSACSSESRPAAEAQAEAIAEQLLDEDIEAEERRALVEAHTEQAVGILRALVRNVETGTDEEARRIPWIWRVAIEATGRNDGEQIRQLIEVSLPEQGAPLVNWQGVVLGGSIVNGISRAGGWPKARVREILVGHDDLQARWQHAVKRSYAMAEDVEVPYPWRYDALRMIAMDAPAESIPALHAYLEPGLDDHLHMGAISGLADIRSPEVPALLLAGWTHYSVHNRELVLDGLLRTDGRTEALLDAISEGTLRREDLGAERIDQLTNHESAALRRRAQALMADWPTTGRID